MVVDVRPLVDFAHHGEPTGAALQHAGKREAMAGLFRVLAEPTIKRRLGGKPDIAGNNRFECCWVPLTSPFKFSGVDAVAKDLINGGFLDRAPTGQVFPVGDGGKLLDGMLAGRAKFIEAAH
jgi:hypothetical protein